VPGKAIERPFSPPVRVTKIGFIRMIHDAGMLAELTVRQHVTAADFRMWPIAETPSTIAEVCLRSTAEI
jgi:hypothetical protein